MSRKYAFPVPGCGECPHHQRVGSVLWRMEYAAGRMKDITPSAFHYAPRTEIPLGMAAKQFFDATQEGPLSDILPEEVADGEIIEIDDGLKPHYFYKLDYATVIPLPYFRFSSI